MSDPVITENKRVLAPTEWGWDGIGFCDGRNHLVRNCIIDFTAIPLDGQDEAASCTWGSQARFERCWIRGAGKLILCGSGDEDREEKELGRHIILEDCLLENFGRRGPEVQSGMVCEIERCVIREWGDPNRFSVRNFASWAHNDGVILAHDCVWQQTWKWNNLIRDICAQVGQAWNDEGLFGVLRPTTWMPGIMHALRATDGGHVSASNCAAPWWCIVEGKDGRMNATDAKILVVQLETMAAELDAKLPR